MLMCLKCIINIKLNCSEINYSINDFQLDDKPHDFHLYKREDCELNPERIVNSIMKCKLL